MTEVAHKKLITDHHPLQITMKKASLCRASSHEWQGGEAQYLMVASQPFTYIGRPPLQGRPDQRIPTYVPRRVGKWKAGPSRRKHRRRHTLRPGGPSPVQPPSPKQRVTNKPHRWDRGGRHQLNYLRKQTIALELGILILMKRIIICLLMSLTNVHLLIKSLKEIIHT